MNVTLHDNITRCPQCGGRAKYVDGTFNERDGNLELVSGPPLTRAILEQLQSIAERVQANEITPQQAVKEAAAIDPVIAWIVGNFVRLGIPAIALLVALVALYLQKEALDLQKADSDVSAQFYNDALALLTEQTKLLEQTSKMPDDNRSIQRKGDAPPAAKADEKTSSIKLPSERRKQVNKLRKQKLKERRRMFPRRTRS